MSYTPKMTWGWVYPFNPADMALIFQVEILDSNTKEQLCFLDKVSRFYN